MQFGKIVRMSTERGEKRPFLKSLFYTERGRERFVFLLAAVVGGVLAVGAIMSPGINDILKVGFAAALGLGIYGISEVLKSGRTT